MAPSSCWSWFLGEMMMVMMMVMMDGDLHALEHDDGNTSCTMEMLVVVCVCVRLPTEWTSIVADQI
jgi:hypothetical protein